MDIGFFINYDNQIIQLPVNPDKVTVSYPGNNSTVEIIQLGEINLLKDRKLSAISFKSFFPEGDWFPAVRTRGQFKKPEFYKEFILDIIESKKPCRLVITGINITMKVSIEDFDFYHRGGDHEDMYYSLEFKEYRDYHITQIPIDPSLKTPTATAPKTTPPPAKPVQPAEITIGCNVVLNGRVHYDSYGAKPGKTFSNYKGKVNFINKKGTHPYHVTTPSGGWLGWVTAESVVLA